MGLLLYGGVIMDTVKLYKNPYPYPHYGAITEYKSIQAKPINHDLRSGFVDMYLTFDEVLEFNYISFTRNNRTLYAWVDNVETRSGDKLYRVHYNVDPFRTYRSDLVLGDQYIERSPTPTELYDPMLGSSQAYDNIERKQYSIGDPSLRYLVAQIKLKNDEVPQNTPVQPSPYKFYVCPYPINNWTDTTPIMDLMEAIASHGQSDNLTTIYSIPYINISELATAMLPVTFPDAQTTPISGWYLVSSSTNFLDALTTFTPIDVPAGLTKVKSSVQVVIPEAGIIQVPPELYGEVGLGIKQSIDLYSGACNYMLSSALGLKTYAQSVRGASTSSIPIVSDPYETYISQNQNSLVTSIMGDVATVGAGVAMTAMGNPMGAGSVMGGATNLLGKAAANADAKNMVQSNPPAFLGTALATEYNQTFWTLIQTKHVDNEEYVHNNLGYPCERFQPLVIPSNGFIKTQGCNLASNGSVPLWAINEMNNLFNNGIVFH